MGKGETAEVDMQFRVEGEETPTEWKAKEDGVLVEGIVT